MLRSSLTTSVYRFGVDRRRVGRSFVGVNAHPVNTSVVSFNEDVVSTASRGSARLRRNGIRDGVCLGISVADCVGVNSLRTRER